MTYRTCKACGETKDYEVLFKKQSRTCKSCHNEQEKLKHKKRYHTDTVFRERIKNHVRKMERIRSGTPTGRAIKLYKSARRRALKSGVDFSITVADCTVPLACPKTGLALDLGSVRSTRFHPLAPSLDRCDPRKGYVSGNVQVVCSWYNMAKNDFTAEHLLMFCRAVVDANR